MRALTVVLICLVSTAAGAAPLRTTNGEAVHVRLGDRSERGLGLRPQRPRGSWRLELAAPSAHAANVYDVTRGVPSTKWVVAVENGALTFDAGRFVAGHAYRIELPGADAQLVYLYAPARDRSRRVVFSETDDTGDAKSDDGIAILPKSAL